MIANEVSLVSFSSIQPFLLETTSQTLNNTSSTLAAASIDFSTSAINYRRIADLCLAIISLVGLLGNSTVVYILYNCSSIRASPYFTLLINQSVADIGSCLMTTLWLVTNHTVNKTGMAGIGDWILCTFIQSQYLLAVTVVVSSYNLSAISLERMASVVVPVKHRLLWTSRSGRMVAVSLWVFGTLTMMVIACPINGIRKNGTCHFWSKFPDKTTAQVYSVFFVFFYNVMPALIMLAAYVVIYLKLSSIAVPRSSVSPTRLEDPQIHRTRDNDDQNNSVDVGAVNDSGDCSTVVVKVGGSLEGGVDVGPTPTTRRATTRTGANNNNNKQTHSVVKVMATCVLAYVLCHGGRAFMSIAARFDTSGRFPMTGVLYTVTLVAMQTNSAVNPVIYALQYSRYRKELRRQVAKLLMLLGVKWNNSVADQTSTAVSISKPP